MKNTRQFLSYVAGAIFLLGIFGGYTVLATSEADIQYPVAELGNCGSEQECRAYCDDLGHVQECIAFAEAHNLFSAEELAKAKRFAQLGVESGPGGCTSKAACQAYCEDVSHITECLAFAEEHDVFEPEELAEARQVAAALQAGAQLPGGCKSRAECEAYCQGPNHIEECVEFALAAGFIPPEEADEVRRMIPLMKEGRMPEACRSGKEECEAYCSDEANIEECVTFFVEAGFMGAEEAEMFRKTGGRGPGGCAGREECEAFCNDSANQEECFAFAKEHDLIPEEELRDIEEGLGRFREGLRYASPEVAQCLKDTVGEDVLAKIEAGTFLPNREHGEHMRRCFEQYIPDVIERDIRERIGEQAPPEGQVPEEFRGEFERQYEEQFEQQYREEFERQQQEFQQQFERQYQEEFQRQLEQEDTHSGEPAPEAGFSGSNFLGAVWDAMKPALKRFIPSL